MQGKHIFLLALMQSCVEPGVFINDQMLNAHFFTVLIELTFLFKIYYHIAR